MNIRQSVTLVAITVALSVSAILILVAHIDKARIQDRVAHEVIKDRTLIWKQVIEHLFERMEAGIPAFEDDFYLRKALKDHDENAVKQTLATLSSLTGELGHFDRLDLFDASGKLQSGGDTLVSEDVLALMRMTSEDGARHRSLGRNAQGEPVALVAFRLSMRHESVGSLVLQKQLTTPLDRFKAISGSEVYLLGATGELVAGTNPSLFEPLGFETSSLDERSYRTLVRGDAAYAVTRLPITGLGEQPIAQLVSVSDDSEAFAAQRRFEWIAYSLLALVLVLATSGLYWYMRRTLRPLQVPWRSPSGSPTAIWTTTCASPVGTRWDSYSPPSSRCKPT